MVKKIKVVVDELVAPSIRFIKRTRKRRTMPYKDIETILKIFFPRTRFHATGKGFFKRVFADDDPGCHDTDLLSAVR